MKKPNILFRVYNYDKYFTKLEYFILFYLSGQKAIHVEYACDNVNLVIE